MRLIRGDGKDSGGLCVSPLFGKMRHVPTVQLKQVCVKLHCLLLVSIMGLWTALARMVIAIGHVRLSVRLFPLYLWQRVTFDVDCLHSLMSTIVILRRLCSRRQGIEHSVASVCVCVCLFVRTLRGKRLQLSIPNTVEL